MLYTHRVRRPISASATRTLGSLDTTDITGSQPRVSTQITRTDVTAGLAKDFGDASQHYKRTIRDTNKPDFALTTADINGAKRSYALKGGRVVNPLQPEYQLPSYPPPPADPVPKFLRNNMDTADLGEWSRCVSLSPRKVQPL